jgi:Fe-S cluster assembly ATP-binding protein
VFEKMHEKTKGNILIISHQERILNIADKIVVIANGQVQSVGEKNSVLPQLLNADSCRVLTDKL